jgi:outer membrane protein TolC
VKGQQLFHSFLPGVTAAVLTTQPAWADTVKVSGVELASSPSVLTSNYGRTLVAEAMNTQLPDQAGSSISAQVPSFNWTSLNVKPVTYHSISVMGAGITSWQKAPILRENQGRFFSMAPTLHTSHPLDWNSTKSNQRQTTLATSSQKSEKIVVPTSISKLSSARKKPLLLSSLKRPTTQKKNSNTQLRTASQAAITGVGAAKLLEIPNCSQGLVSRGCPQPISAMEFTAQDSTLTAPTTESPTPAGSGQTPTVPATVSPTPAGSGQTPTVPGTVLPTPAGSGQTPTVPATVSPTPGGTVPIPDNLNPNPNPLQFPTKPEEVRLQANQPISLEQALELARRNNRELQVAVLELERSQAALREAQAALLPNASINADITRQRSVSDTYRVKVQEQQQAGLPPALRQPIESAPTNTNFSGQAQITYDIYTSGRRQANIRAAEEQVRFNELAVERQSEEIRLNVSTEYYDLQQGDEQVRIAQSSVENAQASLRDAEALERAGVGTRFDVLRSQVNLANSQQDLTNAISQQQIARRRLAARLSLSQSGNISAADPVKLAGLWNQSLEQSIVLAFQNRPELQQQLAQRNINEQQRRQALAALGPQVSLVASYDFSDTFNDDVSVSDGYSLGVRASLNLFDGGAARARAAQARANIAIAETQFADQRNQIRFQVEQAFSNQQSNLENVQTANTALEQAREALRLARLRFQAGVGTQTDVINSENDLTRAEGNRIRAILDYNRALAQLQRSVTSRALR